MSVVTVETIVSAVLSAAHRAQRGAAVLHGHSWLVTATFAAGPCALVLQRSLQEVLERLDHRVLPDELGEAEDLAMFLLAELPDAVCVECARPLERLSAIARRR